MKKTKQQILEEVRIHNSLLIESAITDFMVSPEVRGIVNAAALAATIAGAFFPPAGLIANAARGLQIAQLATSAGAAADAAWNPDTKLVGAPSDYVWDAGAGLAANTMGRHIEKVINNRSGILSDIIRHRQGVSTRRAAPINTDLTTNGQIYPPSDKAYDPLNKILNKERKSDNFNIATMKDRFFGRDLPTNINRVQRNIDTTLNRLGAPKGVRVNVSRNPTELGSADPTTQAFLGKISNEDLRSELATTLRRERPFRQLLPAAVLGVGSSQPGFGLLTPELGNEFSDREAPSLGGVVLRGGVKDATRAKRFTTSALPYPRGLLTPAQQLGSMTTSPTTTGANIASGFVNLGVLPIAAGAVGSKLLGHRN